MILFHGSNTPIEVIDLDRCRPFKDFGRGFYLTSLEQQAWNMANRATRIQGVGEPVVTAFDLAEDWRNSGLNVLYFDGPSQQWAEFIMNNRDRAFTDCSSPNCNRNNQYDVVFGPVADDAIVASFQLYQDGRIDINELVKRFEYRELSDQFSFHTPRALKLLTNLGAR